jgi:D-3-phosphoglycerate dehydrogenase
MKTSHSLSKEKIKILLLEGVHPYAVEIFREYGYNNIENIPTTLNQDALREKIKDIFILGVRSRTRITADILEQATKLITIGCFCIGTDQISLEDAAHKGIPVFNAPHSNTRSVAELVIGLLIMLLRDIFPRSTAAHRSEWLKSAQNSFEARGKTIGIIGYGHIGSQVSILAEALGMQVIYYDIKTKLPLGNARSVNSLEKLLKLADIVTLHVPEDDTTIQMINVQTLALMKKGSYLINASRGKVVDLVALSHSLKSGDIRGAAVDVFPREPESNQEKFESPLIGLENVILTPHIGGSTQEAQKNISAEVASKLVYYSDRGSTETAVNFPMVSLRPNENAHRILHTHENRPGMLSAINEQVASKGINVLGQYLETNHQIGYVVLDIDKRVSKSVLKSLRQNLDEIDGTIRTRLLY